MVALKDSCHMNNRDFAPLLLLCTFLDTQSMLSCLNMLPLVQFKLRMKQITIYLLKVRRIGMFTDLLHCDVNNKEPELEGFSLS